jgi:hypothetical protein
MATTGSQVAGVHWGSRSRSVLGRDRRDLHLPLRVPELGLDAGKGRRAALGEPLLPADGRFSAVGQWQLGSGKVAVGQLTSGSLAVTSGSSAVEKRQFGSDKRQFGSREEWQFGREKWQFGKEEWQFGSDKWQFGSGSRSPVGSRAQVGGRAQV